MPWMTVIDPDADRPTLIGSRWRRREAAGDEWDEVIIRGVFDLGNDHGGLEYVVSPASFGPALTTTPDALAESYTRAEGDDPAERLAARLRDLEARHG